MSISDERKNKIKQQIQQRVDDRILEKTNGELLIRLVDKCNEQEADALLQMATNNQTTGLHFDSRYEVIDTNTIKYLKKDEEHSFIQDLNKPINKLILGDNYDALRNLLISYQGQVDIIYIDPPYAADSMGNFAATNYTNSLTRDNLLSMLQPRLELAEELLSDRGIIFVSLDDRNQAYVKCLMDEIFGEENFYGEFVQLKGNTQNDAKTIQRNHEYILCYSKNPNELLLTYKNEVKQKVYEDNYILGRDTGASSGHDKLSERINLGYTIYYIEATQNGATGNHNTLIERSNLGYTIYSLEKQNIKTLDTLIKQAENFNSKYGKFEYYSSGNSFKHAIAVMDYDKNLVVDSSLEKEIYKDCEDLLEAGYTAIRPPKRKGNKLGRWTWELSTFQKYWNNNEVLIKNNKNIIKKVFIEQKNIIEENGQKYFNKNSILPLQSVIDIGNTQGTKILKSNEGVIPGCNFSNPKSTEMLKYLFKSYQKTNALILDFFAGSGTTGHAVLELNKEDNGNRKFILCTLKEDNNSNIGIDICAERLKRIMTGSTYKNKTNFAWVEKNKPYNSNLEVDEICKIANTDKNIFEEIDETLYGLDKFTNIKDKIEWVCNNFDNCQKEIKEKDYEL